MTVPQFSRPGAVDLSSLRSPTPPAGGGQPGGGGGGGAPGGSGAGSGQFVIDVASEDSLRQDVVERSLSVLVLASFWSPESPESVEINDTLSRLSDEFAGRFVLARVDVAAHPELAQALGIREIPLVVAIVRGQLAPILQDPAPEAELRAVLQQLVQAAAANGVAGVSPPLSPGVGEGDDGAAAEDDAAEPEDAPAHPEAEAFLLAGDVDRAITEYEAVLRTAPTDDEAVLGLARARLLKRTQGVDLEAARAAAAGSPDDVDTQTLVADLDLLGGHVDDAFGRLIDLVRRTSGDDRDRVRNHLIEMFGVVGEADPRVGKARSALASALF
jgi:putative thioredoxin